MRLAASVAAAALALSACGPGLVEPPRAPGVSVVIKVDGSVPPQSRVTVDDQVVGPLDFAAEHGLRVPAGTHRMTVTAPGYLPFDRAFEATTKPVVVTVSLRQSPD